MDEKEVIEHVSDDETGLNDKADTEGACEEVTEEKAVEQEAVQKESEKNKGKETDTSTLLNDADLSQSDQEFIKRRESILSNGLNMSDNITVYQFFGDYMSGNARKIDFGEQNEFDDVSIGNKSDTDEPPLDKKEVKIDLSDNRKIYEYLKENRQSPYCAFLIALSIFEKCQLELVRNEAEMLYSILSDEQREIIHPNGEHQIVQRESFEVSQKELTDNFGLCFYNDYLITFGGRIRSGFVRFASKEYSDNILRVIFTEFITLKNKIVGYLTQLICSEKISLYVAAINAIKKICDINPEFFISGIVTRLIKNKTVPSDIAVAEILCSIAQLSDDTYNAERFLEAVYGKNKDVHYYITTLLTCKTLKYDREKIAKLIRPILRELETQPHLEYMLKNIKIELPEEENYIKNVGVFYNIGERYAEYYIALIYEFCRRLDELKRSDPQRVYVQLVLTLFIQEDYNESYLNTDKPTKFKDMIFIRLVLRDKETADKLTYLWAELLGSRNFSLIAKKLLENYLFERDKYNLNEKEYKKIELFFVRLVQTAGIHKTMMFFLKNMATSPKEHNRIVCRIYEKVGGNRYEQ